MNGAVGRVGENARSAARARGQEVRPGELPRHSLYTRIVHWTSAAFFILALISGFALYTPWFWRLIMLIVRNVPNALFHRTSL